MAKIQKKVNILLFSPPSLPQHPIPKMRTRDKWAILSPYDGYLGLLVLSRDILGCAKRPKLNAFSI